MGPVPGAEETFNPKMAMRRLGDRARQLGYHNNQIRVIANEIIDLSEEMIDWIDSHPDFGAERETG